MTRMPAIINWDTAQYPNGLRTVSAVAADNEGTQIETPSVTITICHENSEWLHSRPNGNATSLPV